MGNIVVAYGTNVALTKTLASLASSSTLLAGWETGAIDNAGATPPVFDYQVDGVIRTGTSPTAGTIEVWAVGIKGDGSTWPDVFDGTSSAETITSADIKNAFCKLIALMPTDTTSNRDYHFGPASIRQAFGMDAPPRKWVLFVAHSTVAALNSTEGQHVLNSTPIYFQN